MIRNNKGFALIITIMIFCLIVPLTFIFNMSSEFYMVSAANLKYGAQLNCSARSGFNYALAVLHEDAISTQYDSKNEPWAEPFSSEEDSAFGDGQLTVTIHDHSGRININKLIGQAQPGGEEIFDETRKEMLTRLLHAIESELEDDEIDDIVNAIKDWIDLDDEVSDEGGVGAENSHYQGLSRPVWCRNGPLKDIEELSLVKGIDDAIFRKLSKYLTTYGDGSININTAPPEVLASLSDEMNSELAGKMVEYRTDEKNDLSKTGWYKDVPGMNDITLEDITVSSTHFEVISTGSRGDMKRVVRSIVERGEKGSMKVLLQKVE